MPTSLPDQSCTLESATLSVSPQQDQEHVSCLYKAYRLVQEYPFIYVFNYIKIIIERINIY